MATVTHEATPAELEALAFICRSEITMTGDTLAHKPDPDNPEDYDEHIRRMRDVIAVLEDIGWTREERAGATCFSVDEGALRYIGRQAGEWARSAFNDLPDIFPEFVDETRAQAYAQAALAGRFGIPERTPA